MAVENNEKRGNMNMEKGYLVQNIGAIYYTQDVDGTLAWFNEVFGWGGGVFDRDENGNGTMGSVGDIPSNNHRMGFRLMKGEPEQRTVLALFVEEIEVLHQYVKQSGWDKITDLETAPWGGKQFMVTTIDGSVIGIFG